MCCCYHFPCFCVTEMNTEVKKTREDNTIPVTFVLPGLARSNHEVVILSSIYRLKWRRVSIHASPLEFVRQFSRVAFSTRIYLTPSSSGCSISVSLRLTLFDVHLFTSAMNSRGGKGFVSRLSASSDLVNVHGSVLIGVHSSQRRYHLYFTVQEAAQGDIEGNDDLR